MTNQESTHYPIQVRIMTKQETKEYHLKKLYELSLKSLEKNPQQEKPNEEQERKMIEVAWNGWRSFT